MYLLYLFCNSVYLLLVPVAVASAEGISGWGSKMRATPKRFVKSLFLCSVMGFLVINLNLFLRADDDTAATGQLVQQQQQHDTAQQALPNAQPSIKYIIPPSKPLHAAGDDRKNQTFNRIIKEDAGLMVQPPKKVNNNSFADEIERFDPKDFLKYRAIGTDTVDIQAYIKAVNQAQPIRNLDKFDLPTSKNTIVIVVQVSALSLFLLSRATNVI